MWTRFLALAEQHGAAITLVPGREPVCTSDIAAKVITLGNDLSADEQSIVGLHELGHIVTLRRYPPSFALMAKFNKYSVYCVELMAWAWAEEHVPEPHAALFHAMRSTALQTYHY